MTLNRTLKANPVINTENVLRSRKVYRRFSPWLIEGYSIPWDLMLYPFTVRQPLMYFDPGSVSALLSFFEKNGETTLDSIVRFGDELSHATSHMLQASSSGAREENLSISSASSYAEVERVWHPEYQRYAEHVYNHLINIPLAILESQQNKQYCGAALSKRVGYLETKLGLKFLTNGFSSVVRNAISHGRVSFEVAGIFYKNQRPNGDIETLELTSSALLKHFDNLVATCNEIVVSLILFLLRNWHLVEKLGPGKLPVGVLQLAITGAGTHEKLQISRLIESKAITDKKQLNISCSTSIQSRVWQTMTALQMTALIQNFVGTKYQRFAISYDCGRKTEASIFLDGERLHKAVQDDDDSSVLEEIIETSLLWFDSHRWRLRFINYGLLTRAIFKEAYDVYLENSAQKGIPFIPRFYKIKSIDVVGAKNGVGVEVKVVLRDGVSPDRQTLRRIVTNVINRVKLRLYRRQGIAGNEGLLQWPSYIRLYIYPRDNVLRRLQGRIINGALVEVEWARRPNEGFLYIKVPHEVENGVRMRFSESVLKGDATKLQMQEVANHVATRYVQNYGEIRRHTESTLQEIALPLTRETASIKQFWLFEETKRYTRWVKLLKPICSIVTDLLSEHQGIDICNRFNEVVERLPDLTSTKEDDIDPSDPALLAFALEAFFLQSFLMMAIETTLVKNYQALELFNAEYQGVLARCADTSIEGRDTINVSSGVSSGTAPRIPSSS